MLPFFKIFEEDKSTENSFKDYFLENFKPVPNKKT